MPRNMSVLAMCGIFALLTMLIPPMDAGDAKDKDIVETAVAAGKFKTLAAALEAAGLIDTLKGKGPFTVFAPTDEAFAKLPKGTVEALLKDKKRLTTVLTYHVAPKAIAAGDITKFESVQLKSVEGSPIAIQVGAGGVTLNRSSKVTQADIACRNGVIHVIDTVILPPALSEADGKEIVVAFCKSVPKFNQAIVLDLAGMNWDRAAERNKEFLDLVMQLKEVTPKVGTKKSWDAEVNQVIKGVNEIADGIDKKDSFATQKAAVALISRACFSCHQSHKAR